MPWTHIRKIKVGCYEDVKGLWIVTNEEARYVYKGLVVIIQFKYF